MQPTLNDDPNAITRDVAWMSRLARYNPKRGEIVAFVCPTDHTKSVVKRVAAIPGDVVHHEGALVREYIRINMRTSHDLHLDFVHAFNPT